MSRWDDHFHQSPDYTPVHTAMDGINCQGTLLDPAPLLTYFLVKTRTPEIKQLDVWYSNKQSSVAVHCTVLKPWFLTLVSR